MATQTEEQKAKAQAEAEAEQAAAIAAAEQAAPAAESDQRLDETVPGGRFIVNGVAVNANGQPIDEDGNVIKE